MEEEADEETLHRFHPAAAVAAAVAAPCLRIGRCKHPAAPTARRYRSEWSAVSP